MSALSFKHTDTLTLLAPLLMSSEKQDCSSNLDTLLIDLGGSNDELLRVLDYHGIALLLSSTHTLPPELERKLHQRRAMVIASEALNREALLSVFRHFTATGLTNAVLFKGGALAHTLYPQPWLRPRSDVDVLIEESDRKRAHAVLSELGYQKEFAIEGKYVSYQSSYALTLAGGSHLYIDLHWRINNRQSLSQAYTATNLYQQGQRLSALDNSVTAPCSVDSLLIACLHRLGHHASDERLIWLYDIHLLANELSQQGWSALINKAQKKQLCAVVKDGLNQSRLLFNSRIPSSVLTTLGTTHNEPSAIFLSRSLPEWRYFWVDVRSMPSIKARLKFIRETVLPSPAYVRQQMATRSALLAYLKRFVRGFKRVRKG